MARRNSHSRTHRDHHSDFLDELESDNRPTRNEPAPLLRPAVPVRTFRVEDRRNWAPGPAPHPQRVPARDFAGRKARIVHTAKAPRVVRGPGGKPLQAKRSVLSRLESSMPRFAEARKTVICFKRKVQREVLHALKRTKSGRGARKKRNEWSDVQC